MIEFLSHCDIYDTYRWTTLVVCSIMVVPFRRLQANAKIKLFVSKLQYFAKVVLNVIDLRKSNSLHPIQVVKMYSFGGSKKTSVTLLKTCFKLVEEHFKLYEVA